MQHFVEVFCESSCSRVIMAHVLSLELLMFSVYNSSCSQFRIAHVLSLEWLNDISDERPDGFDVLKENCVRK